MKMRIGFTCGAFDLCHAGHVLMLQEVRQNCDKLIVGLQVDPSEDRAYKNAPIQCMDERRIQLEAVKYVDEIVEYTSESSLCELLLELLDRCTESGDELVRFLGEDWRGKNFTGHSIAGISNEFNSREHSYSSSDLRRRVGAFEASTRIPSKPKVAVVVGHPDDEVLWLGGTISKYRDLFDLDIIVATGWDDVVRTGEFKSVCDKLGATAIMLKTYGWFGEVAPPDAIQYGRALLRHALTKIAWCKYSAIITHSAFGELNQNEDHRAINADLKSQLQKEGWLGVLLSFGIGTDFDLSVQLNQSDRAFKKELAELHKSQLGYIKNVLHYADTPVEFIKVERL